MNEIKTLIEKYGLVKIGDKVAARKPGINRDDFIRDCAPHKAEIIAYFEAQRNAEYERYEKRNATFGAIPGVSELRAMQDKINEWWEELHDGVAAGDGHVPAWKRPSDAELKALTTRYPMAAWALDVEKRVDSTENFELHAIYKDAYDALCDGVDPAQAKAECDRKCEEFRLAHAWD